ncbi:hypothetical protein FV219_05305 [Methylobacterium sp. WL122]|nr:hypothetical protein FV219_05305 [Methylobacterium sp. WL122]
MKLQITISSFLAIFAWSAQADSCSSVIPGAQMGPAPSFKEWPWSNACYIVWEGGYINGKNARFTYEPKCQQLPGYLHFEGDFGSNRNICVFEEKKASINPVEAVPKINHSEDEGMKNSSANKIIPKLLKDVEYENQIQNAWAKEIFSYNYQASSRFAEIYSSLIDEKGKLSESHLLDLMFELKPSQQEIYSEARAKNTSRYGCLIGLQSLLEHSGETGLINIAYKYLEEYKNECEEFNYFGLNSVYRNLYWRFTDISTRIKSRTDILIKPEFIGVMSAANCRGMGGTPDSTISSPKDTDPPRGCTRNYFNDRRASQFRPRGPGLCPNGGPASTSGVCPAN